MPNYEIPAKERDIVLLVCKENNIQVDSSNEDAIGITESNWKRLIEFLIQMEQKSNEQFDVTWGWSIDIELRELCFLLNHIGIETSFSCSGHPERFVDLWRSGGKCLVEIEFSCTDKKLFEDYRKVMEEEFGSFKVDSEYIFIETPVEPEASLATRHRARIAEIETRTRDFIEGKGIKLKENLRSVFWGYTEQDWVEEELEAQEEES